MEQPSSIFNDTAADISNQSIYSIARWCRFLGFVSALLALFIFAFAIGAGSFFESIFLLIQDVFSSNPIFDSFHLLPIEFILGIVITIAILLSIAAFVLFKISKSGLNYYYTHEHTAFVKMMRFVQMFFILGIINTIIFLIPSFLTLSRIL